MKVSTLCKAGALVLVMCAVGCIPPHVPLTSKFWSEAQQHKVIVATTEAPLLQARRIGGQGLLENVINEMANVGFEGQLQSIDISWFDTVTDKYVEKLKERGFDARRLDEPVLPLSLRPFSPTKTGEFAERDMRPLGQSGDADLLILLSLTQCGTIRQYYSFFPVGAPQAQCSSKGEMIDLKTNGILWRAHMDPDTSTLPISGEWDQPPDYPNLTAALNKAVTKAQAFVFDDFFGAGTATFTIPTAADRPPPHIKARGPTQCTDTAEFRNASPLGKKRILEDCKQQPGSRSE